MAFRKKVRETPDIDVGAFSDIAFLLIIFFILTTTFEKFMGNTVDIPSGAPGTESSEDKQNTIIMDANKIHFNEEEKNLSIVELQLKLNSLKLGTQTDNMKKMILVESSDTVIYDSYFKVINAIAEAGGILAIIDKNSDEE